MKYYLSIPLLLFFLLTACQEEEREQRPGSHLEGTINFGTSRLETRGEPLLQLSELTAFKVLAYHHAGLWEDVSAAAPAALFMSHVPVTQAADNTWSYSPLRFWPNDGNLSFFGYAPEASLSGTPNAYGLSITTPTDGQFPQITYTVPGTVENQPDLLLSVAPTLNLNRASNGNSAIDLQFAHALTCVGFKATGKGERITSITISGIVGTGTITLNNSTLDWNVNPVDTTYTFEAGVNDMPLDGTRGSVLKGDGYLMMIPQTLSDNARITITIDGGDIPYKQTLPLNIPGKEVWQPGQFLEYQFAVTPTSAIMLSPESLVIPAAADSYSSFVVICPDDNPNLTWTVNAPDGDWLQISDTPAGTNQVPQNSPYTYTGTGSQRLYAFAPNANTSTPSLSSTITLTGTSQLVQVTQLYQNEVYVPKYPHDGWAGSNIYWVPDNTYPKGGYLTFDDKDETTHERHQGVYFMWGSLVALSPLGIAWNGGVWDGNTGQILYMPNSDPASNGGWNPTQNSSWGYIPRAGWTDSSNPNGTGTALSIAYNDQQSYLIQNHSPLKNIGDICRYITEIGWAPGAKEGRKWRMPTHIEYLQLTDYAKESAPFVYQISTNAYGQASYAMGFRRERGSGTPFFPNSGFRMNVPNFHLNGEIGNTPDYRPGEAFSYWTSSPRDRNGDAFDYVKFNSLPTNTQGFNRDTGGTIRCVMENNER